MCIRDRYRRVGKIVSGFQKFHVTATEPQIESSIPWRGLVWVGQLMWQTVQRSGWTGDFEGVIVRTFDAGTSWRTQFRHMTDETLQRYAYDLETSAEIHTHIAQAHVTGEVKLQVHGWLGLGGYVFQTLNGWSTCIFATKVSKMNRVR